MKLVHVTPAHQSPTGITMPVSRRLELLDWAAQAGVWVVEDDYDSEFNYDGAPLAALKSLDGADRVIHCGSFNKTLFNALRIGYAVVPKALAPAFAEARRKTGRSGSLIEQMTLARFLEDGSFARHVRKARGVYARRRDAALQALRQAVGAEALRVSGEHAGFHLLWWLPPGWDARQVVEAGRKADVGVQDVAEFARKATPAPGVVIGYSAVDEARLRRLGALLAALRPGRAWIRALPAQQRTRRRNDGNDGTGGGRCGLSLRPRSIATHALHEETPRLAVRLLVRARGRGLCSQCHRTGGAGGGAAR